MKIMNFKETKNIFDEFILSTDEMFLVRGGTDDGDPIVLPPPPPPVKI